MYFSKKVYMVYWGIFEHFVLKVTLHYVRLLLTESYRKNGGAGCNTCSPNNFVGWATALDGPKFVDAGTRLKIFGLWRAKIRPEANYLQQYFDIDITSYVAFKQSLTGVILIKFRKVYFM